MQIVWLKPWCEVTDGPLAESFRAELLREVPPGHVLRGMTVLTAIAYREDRDDVAFALPDGRIALVHLTWSRREAMPPNHPTTDLLDSLATFQHIMEQHHRDWA
jgi:hypothetical protein